MPRHWYVKTQDGMSAPVNCRQLLLLAADAKIFPNTHISCDGETWIKARELKELTFPDLESGAWYLKTNQGKAGPYTLQTLQALVDSGTIQHNSAIRSNGRKWIKAKRVPALSFPDVDPSSHDDGQDRGSIDATWAHRREKELASRMGPLSAKDRGNLPAKPRIDVCVHAPSPGRPFTTLVTSGMSDWAMDVPVGRRSPRAELVMYVDQMQRAYINLIRSLAQSVHQNNTWFGYGSTLTNGSPSQPIFAGSKLDAYTFLVPNVESDFRIHESVQIDSSPLQLLWVVPITMAEREVILSHGMSAFCHLCDNAGMSLTLDPFRACVVETAETKAAQTTTSDAQTMQAAVH